MAQNPAALHLDPASRPRPHRPALVATPGASEWVSCVSSPVTNRSGRTLEKGAENLANSPAAFQVLLDDTVSQPPVPKYRSCFGARADLIRTLVKGDRCACIIRLRRLGGFCGVLSLS